MCLGIVDTAPNIVTDEHSMRIFLDFFAGAFVICDTIYMHNSFNDVFTKGEIA